MNQMFIMSVCGTILRFVEETYCIQMSDLVLSIMYIRLPNNSLYGFKKIDVVVKETK